MAVRNHGVHYLFVRIFVSVLATRSQLDLGLCEIVHARFVGHFPDSGAICPGILQAILSFVGVLRHVGCHLVVSSILSWLDRNRRLGKWSLQRHPLVCKHSHL